MTSSIDEEARNLTDLLTYVDYHCLTCGAKLLPPTMKTAAYHILGGSPILQGKFRCPNERWWKIWTGHTELLAEYKNCNLNVYEEGSRGWKHYERLWEADLEERRRRE